MRRSSFLVKRSPSFAVGKLLESEISLCKLTITYYYFAFVQQTTDFHLKLCDLQNNKPDATCFHFEYFLIYLPFVYEIDLSHLVDGSVGSGCVYRSV
jgi:hypothetical protein